MKIFSGKIFNMVVDDLIVQTFFRENASQRKELDILKKLSAGNFCHDNLCAILDVCSDRAPVSDWRGKVSSIL